MILSASRILPFLLNTLLWHPAASFITLERQYRHPPLRAEFYTVTVQYEGTSCDIQVRNSETILDALERTGAADTLAMPEMPSNCRRGNCMTCSAKSKDHQHSLVIRSDDGLSPDVSQQLKKSGYLLICSSYVQGDGLTLELGQNHGLWDIVYRQRFESESARSAARAALARLLRRNAENNIEQWTQEIEAMLEKSGNEDSRL
jgi:ferredoxin